ncbi:MFS transporter [Aciditerrimonas ferrireducens]|uniref:MFS transporter n=1 Tax=Aciditerrimonas ferrireducens TaxID=667306 RepID=A0ABV6C3Z9_9ACTN|nr:MFS transporter [Aciditerrimonas ferrireducens]MCK4176644.1 MFS transporter [Aciditerrimonas ferrireducens]
MEARGHPHLEHGHLGHLRDLETAVLARWHRPNYALAVVTLVLFLTFLDNTVVTVVLADVQSALHAGVSDLQWVVNGYALTFASLMLSFGALADRLGRKRVMLSGVAVFCAGSVICALAPSIQVLIAGRVVMGVGAAASEPGTLSMIRHLFDDRERRARALGAWAAVSGLALATGPVIGGVLAGAWSWRAIFWFNVAFGLLALVAGAALLPESADPDGRGLDVPGALLGAAALGCLSFGVILGETHGYRAAPILGLLSGSGALAVLFVLWERRSRHPVLDVRAFSRPAFSGATAVAFAVSFATFAVFFFVALYLQVVANRSPDGTALVFAPMAVAMIAGAGLAGPWVARSGARLPMVVGCLAGAAGVALTDAFISPTTGLATLGWTLAIAGFGLGVALVPVTAAALSSMPPERSSTAASTVNTSRELGAVVGVAALGSVVNGQLTVDLVHQLAAVGIPKQFQAEVITAVTTGSFNAQAAKAAHASRAIAHIVFEVEHAAYHAFGNGLHLSLGAAAGLLLVGTLISATAIRRRSARSFDITRTAEPDPHSTPAPGPS